MNKPLRTLYLHIGGEKTGTTTLQVFLRDNAPQLRKRGLIYPANNRHSYFSGAAHAPVVAGLIKDDAVVEFVSIEKLASSDLAMCYLLRCLRNCGAEKAVISAEHFSSRLTKTSHLIALRNALLEVAESIKIVFYLREQAGLAISAYSTAVQCGRRNPFDANEVNAFNPYYNHLSTLELWGNVFGVENLILREFDRQSLYNGDIIDDFFNVIDVPITGLVKPPRRNESLDAISLELIREVNLLLPTPDEDLLAYHEAHRFRKNVLIRHLRATDRKHIRIRLSDQVLILDRFKNINDLINNRYMNGRLTHSWFAPCRSENGPCDQVVGRDDVFRALCDAYLCLAKSSHHSKVPARQAIHEKAARNLRKLFGRTQLMLREASKL